MVLPGSIPLFTRMRREIPNAQTPDIPPASAQRAIELNHKKYPLAELRRPPTGQYNCHGMTFASRRTGIHDPDAVKMILQDDGYKEITAAGAWLGDIAVLCEGEEVAHTGVVIRIIVDDTLIGGRAIWIMSKWGGAAEYVHPVAYGPYDNCRITYWTERP